MSGMQIKDRLKKSGENLSRIKRSISSKSGPVMPNLIIRFFIPQKMKSFPALNVHHFPTGSWTGTRDGPITSK